MSILFRPQADRPVVDSLSTQAARVVIDQIIARVEDCIASRPSSFFVTGAAPDWTDIKNAFVQAATINNTRPVPEHLSTHLKGIVRTILTRKKPGELLHLLRLLCSYNYFDTKQHVGAVVTVLLDCYPTLKGLLKAKGADYTFTPQGIAFILKIFEKKYHWPKDQITVQNIDTLDERLQELREASDLKTTRAWLLFSPRSDHIVPTFAKKEKDTLQACITDSKGISHFGVPEDGYWLEPFKNRLLKGPEETAFGYSCQRQIDGLTCPVFGTLDLRNILEGEAAGRDIFEFITTSIPKDKLKDISSKSSTSRMFSFSLLPPEMMKVTQSVKQIASYRSSSPTDLAASIMPVFTRVSPTRHIVFVFQTPEIVFQTIDRNIRMNPEGYPLNKYVEKKIPNVSLYANFRSSRTGDARI